MTNQLLELLPNHERANGNKVFYEKHLKEEESTKADKKLKGDDGSDELEEENIVSIKATECGLHDVHLILFTVHIETVQQSPYLCYARTPFI